VFVIGLYRSSRQKVEGENVSRYLESLAERVACSGEVLNINEHEQRGDGIVDSGINSLLAMPIRNKNDQIIGEREAILGRLGEGKKPAKPPTIRLPLTNFVLLGSVVCQVTRNVRRYAGARGRKQ